MVNCHPAIPNDQIEAVCAAIVLIVISLCATYLACSYIRRR